MHYRTLGNSDLKVSRICLGTMTFGNQNSEADAHQQLDYAISQGVNFVDLAEMYPVPTAPELQGRTEQYVGNWMRQRNNRDQLVIATKAAGPPAAFVFWGAHSATSPRGSYETCLTVSPQTVNAGHGAAGVQPGRTNHGAG